MKDLVILGASGDLAKKKLFPAIYQNFQQDFQCKYIGYGRKDISNDEFRDIISTSVNTKDEKFLNKFSYIQGEYNTEGFKDLKELNKERIFYLSLPITYELLEQILTGLKENNLFTDKTLLVLEKPFGTDYTSAKKLIDLLKQNLKEEQIFLVDHYLAKDLVRNLISLRFANTIFSGIWNNKYIEKIEITTDEKVGIENRGEYYDTTGAIKDMIQNHSLQVLSLVTMNKPNSLGYEDLTKEKIHILKNLRIFNNQYEKNVEIGQYKGYTKEEFVKEDSNTETYASLTVEVDTKEWRNVPIILKTGKKLKEKRTSISIFFKGMDSCVWHEDCKNITGNVLSINIYPENDIVLKINSEFNPNHNLPKAIDLRFTLSEENISSLPYANALMDMYHHERSYTPSYEEILLSWQFIDPLLNWLEDMREDILFKY